jgi:hypothetical protein
MTPLLVNATSFGFAQQALGFVLLAWLIESGSLKIPDADWRHQVFYFGELSLGFVV